MVSSCLFPCANFRSTYALLLLAGPLPLYPSPSFCPSFRLLENPFNARPAQVYVWSTGVTTKPPAAEGVGMPTNSAAHAQSRPGSPVSTTQKDTNRSYESFEASQGDPEIVTSACFVPESTSRACVSAIRGGLNKTVADSGGYCGCMILATDYEGSIRVYCKAPILLS